MTVTTVLLDLDGVVRRFDPTHRIGVELRHGIEPGSLAAVAFAPDEVEPVVTGRRTRAEWVERVGRAIGNPGAAREWLDARGQVDHGLMTVVDRLRGAGTPVAVLTNGTDTIPVELVELGIAGRFDVVFNSAEIGLTKPSPSVFAHVCDQLGVEPAEVFFTDDTEGHVLAASRLGMVARLYEGLRPFVRHLAELGLDPGLGLDRPADR
ncbi:HAD family hydrolase [Actinomarinicola tropica]|uniref:HAD-IA family hydrolase n=1 Tax=Actinomarinicola tropica TaxID=2789776 RepID=A0A5Q2RG33_9ACTN|nr:HAD-IA family hydrolase [Actinomarinicola tropica]QGG93762.1 HAD-IA family hydrolase [Actinomarinicola tropica]